MKSLAARTAALLAAITLTCLAIAQNQQTLATVQTHSKHGQGPSILLLHDSSSKDQAWAKTAIRLAERFEITLIDITHLLDDTQAVQHLRDTIETLDLGDCPISGTAHAERLIRSYADHFPSNCQDFTLPHDSEDLKTLALLFNSTTLTKS